MGAATYPCYTEFISASILDFTQLTRKTTTTTHMFSSFLPELNPFSPLDVRFVGQIRV